MEDLLQLQLFARQQRTPYAVATIVEATGSTPRTEGKMLVYADGRSAGTIGGGLTELRAKKDAADAIRCGKNRLVRYEVVPQAAASGMACGGELQVFIEVYGTRPLLVICGGGHVGTCVLRAAKLTGFELWLFDDRPQEAVAEAAALADRFFPVAGDFYEGIAAQAVSPGAFFVICGHSHTQDGEALHAALGKDAAYVGMLGSRRKIAALFERLRSLGVPQAQLDTVCMVQFAEQAHHLLAVLGIQVSRRLVGQNQLRTGHDGTGDGRALLLSSGNLARIMA